MPNHTYRIAVISGDGIGKEVTPEAVKVLQAAARKDGSFGLESTEFAWSAEYYFATGAMVDEDFLEQLQAFDAVLLGALGDPERVPDHITLAPLLRMRQAFDQYACVRPARLFPGVHCPLAGKRSGDIDMVVIRENSEGEYVALGGRKGQGTEEEVAVQTSMFTRKGVARIVRFAFETARTQGRHRVNSITKSNALPFSMVLWDEVFNEVAVDYPDIGTSRHLIDAACQDFVRRPEIFDVVVASNLFGDILTDLGAIICGGLGLAPSANINPERKHPSMFEPVHGSAPDIAGQGIANPIATILSGAMMLRHLGEAVAAQTIEQAVHSHLARGQVLTPDLGGRATTAEVGDALCRSVLAPREGGLS